MSSFNFEKTRRKNFKCDGELPLPSLIEPPLLDSHHTPRVGENSSTNSESLHITKSVFFYNQKCKKKEYMT